MKTVIAITSSDYTQLQNHLLKSGDGEEAAILIGGVSRSEQEIRMLVREVIPVPQEAFLVKHSTYLSINPDFLAPLIKRCRLEQLSFILAHSHPFTDQHVVFSGIDDAGEAELFPRIQRRAPDTPHAAIVFGQSSIDVRVWLPGQASSQPVDLVKVVGLPLLKLRPTGALVGKIPSGAERDEGHHRQILAFGEEGQKLIKHMRAAIVGVGGIGSQVYQQLAHLGVEEITIVDDDRVEKSNLSRIVGSSFENIGELKVEVMKALGKKINPKLHTLQIPTAINAPLDPLVAMALKDVDVIFCCTDNLRSRVILDQLAYRYFIPVIDMGLDIQLSENQLGQIRAIGGRVMVIYPDGPCLSCLGVLSKQALKLEEQVTQPSSYIGGQVLPNPSVISLNGVITSLAVTEFINLATGFAERPSRIYQRYDGIKGVVKSYELVKEEPCNDCIAIKGIGDREGLTT